jgi:hypothetical protein
MYVEEMQDPAFRAALPGDAYALAELAISAGDGMYEFLLKEMAPKEMLAGLMARSIKQGTGGLSWRNCFVAVDQGVVIGMINAFPAAWLREEEQDILPQDRVQVLEPIERRGGSCRLPASGDRESAHRVVRRASEGAGIHPNYQQRLGG